MSKKTTNTTTLQYRVENVDKCNNRGENVYGGTDIKSK